MIKQRNKRRNKSDINRYYHSEEELIRRRENNNVKEKLIKLIYKILSFFLRQIRLILQMKTNLVLSPSISSSLLEYAGMY